MSWFQRLLKFWAQPPERRSSPRYTLPLVAYYWHGGPPVSHEIGDISRDGAYIRTSQRWSPGTVIRIILQEAEEFRRPEGKPVTLAGMVVRHGDDGMAVCFVFRDEADRREFGRRLNALRDSGMMPARHRKTVTAEAGNALVEFGLILPLLFLLIVNAINFGGYLFAIISVANAARTGSQYAILAGASVTAPNPATATQVAGIITQDMSSLRNRSSLVVRVCTQPGGGSVTCTTSGSGSFSNPTADTRAEASLYVTAWVDVRYTYQPLIPLFNFFRLGIHATIPTSTIHRQAVMRMLQ